MKATEAAFVFQMCRDSDVLKQNPVIAEALLTRDADRILKHLRKQREWLGALTPIERERMDIRNSERLMYARTAASRLCAYEAVVTPTTV